MSDQTTWADGISAEIKRRLADPNLVHINMLNGHIAKPSVGQIIHIYGKDVLLAALQPKEDR